MDIVTKSDAPSPKAGHEDPDSSSDTFSSFRPAAPETSPASNTIHTVNLFDVPIVALTMDRRLRLCLAQISSTLLKAFSYNEIHNRRVALGINCVQCTPVQLEILRRAGAMPISSRRCGMITKREAERLVKSFLCDARPPALPEDFAFDVQHECGWGCKGRFMPARYNSSRAKCIQCVYCQQNFSPNKFIFHSHKMPESSFSPADAANFNSWRRHVHLCSKEPTEELVHIWEDVKAMFNGGSRRRLMIPSLSQSMRPSDSKPAKLRPSSPTRTFVPKPVHPLPTTPHIVLPPAPSTVTSSSLLPYSPFGQNAASSMLHYEWMYRQHPGMLATLPGYGFPNMWMAGSFQTPTRNFEPWSWMGSPASAYERGRITDVGPGAPPISTAKPYNKLD
ncbi:hypothetical protein RvY_04387 [Ramazzottius varieornatus]|uniref:c-SKI SMAD4-binding domain-containing protein n=1 Tax=Ramazzottius varieornatus TaxID=947166 RepID=A0A1D1UYA0_RAMVA|nr:hypothetical protein RvY_04387 [Ramazzottius varieornatus]